MTPELTKLLKTEIERGGHAYIRNLAMAEYAVSQGHFNLSKILRVLANSQRVLALESARMLAESMSEDDLLETILEEVSEDKDIYLEASHPLTETFQQASQVRAKLRAIIHTSQTSLEHNPDVLESDVAQFLQVCLSCGMVVERGKEPMKYCPVCNAPQSEFEGFGPFYSSTPEHLGHLRPSKIKEILTQTPVDIEAVIGSVSLETLHRKPSAEEWNIAEIVGHLIETDSELVRRVKLMIEEERPLISSKMPWKLHEGKGYETMNAQSLVEKFHSVRQQSMTLLNQLSEDDWNRKGFYSGSETSIISTGSWIANHDIGHLAQIHYQANM